MNKYLQYSTVKPLITSSSKEFIKCRILHFLIMEFCRYLVFKLNVNMELFKTVPAYSSLFIYFRKYWNLREKLSRRHLINSSNVFFIKGFTVETEITTLISIDLDTVKPLIRNTLEEFIKCRLDNFSMSFILYYVNFSICGNK